MSLPITLFGMQSAGLDSGLVGLLGGAGTQAIDTGLVAHWSATLQGGVGTSLIDRTAGGNNLPLAASVTFVADTFGNGTHALECHDEAATSFAGPSTGASIVVRTLSWWFLMDMATANVNHRWYDVPSPRRIVKSIGSQTIPADRVQAYDGSSFIIVGETTYQQWRHCCLCIDDATGDNKRYYLNGVLQANRNTLNLTTMGGSSVSLCGSPGQAGSCMFGFLDTVRLYDRAISAAEVQELFEAGRGEQFTNLPTFNAAWASGATKTIQGLSL